jgi:hypothetical protein
MDVFHKFLIAIINEKFDFLLVKPKCTVAYPVRFTNNQKLLYPSQQVNY